MDDFDEIRRQVEHRVEQERASCGGADPEERRVSPARLAMCFDGADVGDAALFEDLNRGRLVYVSDDNEWLHWRGHHWEVDHFGRHLALVEEVALEYLREADRTHEMLKAPDVSKEGAKNLMAKHKGFLDRARYLRRRRGRENVVKVAENGGLVVRAASIDDKPWLLPCANGVIHLETGELFPGRPDELLMRAAPVEWGGLDAPCPSWEAALMEIFSGDQELVDFMRRVFGAGLIGRQVVEKLIILTGKGRNGKSLIVRTVQSILGTGPEGLTHTCAPEILLDPGRTRNSAQASPDIMALKGKRMVFASETDEGRKMSAARVKSLTGDDVLNGRNVYGRCEQNFRASHTPFLLTNSIPRTPAYDFAFWERVLVVPFAVSFVTREPAAADERRADPMLGDRLESEFPGILAWMVRGCLEYQAGGLSIPPKVLTATNETRAADDVLEAWLEEKCLPGGSAEAWTQATTLYNNFSEWWLKTISEKPWKQRKFSMALRAKGFIFRKSNGIMYYNIGLAL